MILENLNWQLIVVDDTLQLLSGQSICNVIQLLQRPAEFKYVILNELETVGKEGTSLKLKEGEVLEIGEALKYIGEVAQFIWGNFFLFTEYPTNWKTADSDPMNLIKQTDTTLRAMDNQYMFVYTQSQVVVDTLQNNCKIQSAESDELENMDYPY